MSKQDDKPTLAMTHSKPRTSCSSWACRIVLMLMGALALTRNLRMVVRKNGLVIHVGLEAPPLEAPTFTEAPPSTNSTKKSQISSFPNDNDKIPGPFMQDKLYILGARLTTSFEKLDESVWFDMFGHAVGEGAAAGKPYYLSKLPTNGAFNYREAKEQPLYCQLDKEGDEHVGQDNHNSNSNTKHNSNNTLSSGNGHIVMEYVPFKSVDGKTANTQLIWRCNLSPHLSRSLLLQQSHVRVSVFSDTNEWNPKSNIPLFTVDIPVDTATVGYAGPIVKAKNSGSFVEKAVGDGPLGVVLCVVGVQKSAMWVLPEWIQHHLNVGVDHIFIGVDTHDVLPYLQEKLSYYIERGVLVLGSEDHGIVMNRNVRKLRLYNQCLYHAKGISEYVVNWDIDEIWMPPQLKAAGNKDKDEDGDNDISAGANQSHATKHFESPYQTSMSLIEAVRSIKGKNGCTDWCYQTFPSYTIERVQHKQENATEPQKQGFYGFPVREKDLNLHWQKPVIQTKYAYQASFHLGGSCSRANSHSVTDQGRTKKYEKYFKSCPILARDERSDLLGRMHHFLALFRDQRRAAKLKDYPDKDEYTNTYRQTVVQQLTALQGKVRAE